MSIIIFRTAQKADKAQYAQLLTRGVERKKSYGDDAWGQEPYSVKEAAAILDRSLVIVAVRDTKLVGAVSIDWNDSRWGNTTEPAGYIHKLVAEKSERGLGAELMARAERVIGAFGTERVRLDCPTTNQQLCGFYEHIGYQLVRVAKTPNNNDSSLYEKRITPL
jgi:GNAT superfamily N-acetyltransferase